MPFPSATVVAAIIVSLAVASPLEARTATRGAARPASAPQKVAAGLWAPKKASKPRPSREDDDAREEELLKSPRAPAGDAAPRKRRPIKMDESAEEEGEEETEGDDEDEDKPKVTKRRKRVVEEEEDEAPEPLASQPSVIPRLVNVAIGTAMVRRSFAFSQPTLQGDSGFRLGYQLAVESFPLVTQPNGWHRTLGIGLYYEKEYGDATQSGTGGMFTGYGFNQSRWGFDARFAIPAGEWVIIMPAIGYGRIGADLERMSPSMPSACTSGSMMPPCFGDIKASVLSIDLHLRVGFTPAFAMSLSGGYLYGLGVSRGTDQITAEAPAAMAGFHVDLGATVMVNDWFAVQGMIPFRRYAFNFTPPAGGAFTAKSATDLYYGVLAGVALFTK